MKSEARPAVQVRGETIKRMVMELSERLKLSESEIIRIAIARLYVIVMDGGEK